MKIKQIALTIGIVTPLLVIGYLAYQTKTLQDTNVNLTKELQDQKDTFTTTLNNKTNDVTTKVISYCNAHYQTYADKMICLDVLNAIK